MEFYRGIGVIAGELYQEMFVVKNFQCFASIQSFSCVLRAHSAPLYSQEHSRMYIFQHDFVHTALQVSEPSCFISSAQQIGSMGKPRSWHTAVVPSHSALGQMCAGCRLWNGVATCKSLKWVQLLHYHSCLKLLPIIYPWSSAYFNCT